jgi:uncharacterized membrane protein YhaH (DUF805 family)
MRTAAPGALDPAARVGDGVSAAAPAKVIPLRKLRRLVTLAARPDRMLPSRSNAAGWYPAAFARAKHRAVPHVARCAGSGYVFASEADRRSGARTANRGQAMNFLQVLFSFHGRINRAKYWLAVLFWTVVDIVVFAVMGGMLVKDIVALGSEPSGGDIVRVILSFGVSVILVCLLVFVPMIVSGFAIGIKRLHDRDQSGWWILLFYFGPAVASALAHNSDSGASALLLSLVSLGISIWAIVVLGFLRGTRGPNRYGPDPLGADVGTVAPSQA